MLGKSKCIKKIQILELKKGGFLAGDLPMSTSSYSYYHYYYGKAFLIKLPSNQPINQPIN
jgi:hypothetical protein